ncbi:MAG: iron-containing alcohol dehydrogenase [Synergistaceae bacterium]|jgi:3-deoxy-alpha-D-manno-octulosonate 8-oxidase|nr:iron-containing alcohol dehydrogenase [Synergistaceae bacterium]
MSDDFGVRWWRTDVSTRVLLSRDGLSEMFAMLHGGGGSRKARHPFFIVDKALKGQAEFNQLWEQGDVFAFDATASEPRTGDVDSLVRGLHERESEPDIIVGVGGGGTMDLAKAVGICLKNPKPSAEYQGWGFNMARGVDVWVMPTLAGTGAELTPIAVLRGPEKKLGINTPLVAPAFAVIDPALSKGAKHFNRFYTMMDCYFHHREITISKTSAPDAMADARDGLELARSVLSRDLSNYDGAVAVASARASVLGGSSSVSGRVGAAHAISYGLSNSAPTLPHSVAVTISMLGLPDLYEDCGAYSETLRFLETNRFPAPRARDYGVNASHVGRMVKTALGMDKLWLSHFGDGWEKIVTPEFIEKIYIKIIEA